MSKKYALKRIALVAISAMGFGLLSMVPAKATGSDLAITIKSNPAGTHVTQVTSGSTVTVMTRDTTVALADLLLNITTGNFGGEGVLAAGSSTGTVTSYRISAAAGLVGAGSGAVAISTRLATDTGSFGNSLTAGLTYRLWDDENSDKDLDLATEEYLNITVIQTTANHVPVTLDTATTTLAGRTSQQVSITLTGDLTSTAASTSTYPFTRIAASITSRPSGAVATGSLAQLTLAGNTSAANFTFGDTGTTLTSGSTAIASMGSDTGSSSTVATLNYHALGNTAVTSNIADQTVGTLTFTPTAAGVYTISVWNESSSTGIASLSGSESSQTFTINVSAGVSTITLSPINSSASKAGPNGSLIKVSLKDAAGTAAILAPGEAVTIAPSGSGKVAGVNGVATSGASAGGTWNLSAADFNSSGIAWINVTNAVAETSTITASIGGGASASTSVTFRTITASAVAPAPYSATGVGFSLSSGSLYNMPLNGATITFRVTVGSAEYANYSVKENTAGSITGDTGRTAYFDAAALGSATTGISSYSVTATQTTDSANTYSVYSVGAAFAAGTVETRVQGKTNTSGALTVSPASVNAVVGSTNTLTATLKDLFGRNYASQTIAITVSGKNPTAVTQYAVTDAAGRASFSLTDANTNTAVTDTVTFTAGSTATSSISYGTNAVGTVTLEYPGEDDVIAGTTFTEISAAGAGATGTSATVTAIITGSTGALLAGVPVTFAVSGLTGAEVHTTKVTVYTGTNGEAATSISSYAAGKATVTATAGGKSATADIYFKQTGATEARTIEASVSGGVVTATVKDRYGNTIEGVTVNATRTGTGYFGSGASTATGNTDKNGQVEFIFTGTGTVTVAFSSADYGQSADAAGKVGATAVTASAAGTTTTNQTGLGAALAPAGVNSASVSVTSADPAAAAAEAATDAALEAIDAANAATDAANLAAEAADAATVAAEEARDAADAATAAVEALASEVATLMAALKAQITTLANTVAKIAKKVKA